MTPRGSNLWEATVVFVLSPHPEMHPVVDPRVRGALVCVGVRRCRDLEDCDATDSFYV